MTLGPTLPDGRRSLVLVSDNNFAATQFTQGFCSSLSTNGKASRGPRRRALQNLDNEGNAPRSVPVV
jgi:hypothetical protein